ncbi:MAG: hypothetical protein U0572_04915 [Phycisphaerales bacterium]
MTVVSTRVAIGAVGVLLGGVVCFESLFTKAGSQPHKSATEIQPEVEDAWLDALAERLSTRRIEPSSELVDRLHVLLAQSGHSEHGKRRVATELRSLERIALKGAAEGSPGRRFLARELDGCWHICQIGTRLADSGQAHLGQVAWYLAQLPGTDDFSFEIAPDARLPMRDLVIADLSAVAGPERLEWLVPALLHWRSDDGWSDRFQRIHRLDDLAASLLAQSEGEAPCFGGHWWDAVAVIAQSDDSRISSRVHSQARAMVVDHCSAVLDHSIEIVAELRDAEGRPRENARAFARLAHTCLWLARSKRIAGDRNAEAYHVLFRTLKEQLELGIADYRLPDLAHGLQAIRLDAQSSH